MTVQPSNVVKIDDQEKFDKKFKNSSVKRLFKNENIEGSINNFETLKNIIFYKKSISIHKLCKTAQISSSEDEKEII